MTRFADLADVSTRMAATRARKEKTRLLVELLRALEADEVESAVGFLVADPNVGPVGLGESALWAMRHVAPASSPSKSVTDVESALEVIKAAPAASRREAATSLFATLTREEQRFLAGALTGSLRQGGLSGIMLGALAELSERALADVQRAAMVLGGAPRVAHALLGPSRDAPLPSGIELFHPVGAMLAATAESIEEALVETKRPRVEWKVDGVRAQLHKNGERIAVYSRQGNDVTRGVTKAIQSIRFTAESCVLDAEVVLLDREGRACPFQDTFSVVASAASAPGGGTLHVYAFDCLHRDGRDLLDAPLEERIAALAATVPEEARMPAIDDASRETAEAFYEDALARGHEGVMVKDLSAPYAAGARSASWFKVKKVTTVDLVILAVEWGSGRRRGWLSNLHLGARNPDGTFTMVGKTFKGLTDAMLKEQTERLLALETHRDDYVVYVRPELTVEVAFNDVQRSPRYPGGIALRFARVKRHRPDKSAREADTLASLVALAPPDPKASRQLSLFGDPVR